MSPTDARQALAARVERLIADAQTQDGAVPQEHAEQAQRLAGLLDLADRLRPRAPRQRWPMALAFALTLAVVSALLLVHMPRADIEFDGVVSEFSFRLPVDHAISESAPLRSMGVAGAEAVEGADAATTQALAGGSLRLATTAACAGSITLDGIVLPRGAMVLVHSLGKGGRAHLTLNAPGATLQLTLDGCVQTGGSLQKGATRSLQLRLGRDDTDLELELEPPGRAFEFAPLLRATALTLGRVEQVAMADATLVRELSTLVSGSLFYSSLDGLERKLRHGQPLRFSSTSGELRSIEFELGKIHLRYHGDVQGMSTGPTTDPRSLMPTLLEWLRANHSLSLLWGTALYLFGLLGGLLRWWRPSGS